MKKNFELFSVEVLFNRRTKKRHVKIELFIYFTLIVAASILLVPKLISWQAKIFSLALFCFVFAYLTMQLVISAARDISKYEKEEKIKLASLQSQIIKLKSQKEKAEVLSRQINNENPSLKEIINDTSSVYYRYWEIIPLIKDLDLLEKNYTSLSQEVEESKRKIAFLTSLPKWRLFGKD